jgi:hypothetical protein
MANKHQHPETVFLIAPELATVCRLLAQATDQTLAGIIRNACEHVLATGPAPEGLEAQRGRRTARVSLYLPAALKARVQARAAADGLAYGSWMAAAVSTYVTAWTEQNRDVLVPALLEAGLIEAAA